MASRAMRNGASVVIVELSGNLFAPAQVSGYHRMVDSQLAPLEQLRHEIDRIDDAIHDLLMERASVVTEIARAKPPGTLVWRPAREAMIMRRLLARHTGSLPSQAIVAIWREIIGVFAAEQQQLYVTANPGEWVVASNNFGSEISLIPGNDGRMVHDIGGVRGDIGIMRQPDHSSVYLSGSPWWVWLGNRVRVSALLPFVAPTTHVAISKAMPEPTGDDLTWVAARGPFAGKVIARCKEWMLLEWPGFTAPDDPVFQHDDLRYVGSFARPYIIPTE